MTLARKRHPKVQVTDPFAQLHAQIGAHCDAIAAIFTTDVFVSVIVRDPVDPDLRVIVTNDSIDGIRNVLDSPGNVEIFPAKSKE